jgi:hypothetical protein
MALGTSLGEESVQYEVCYGLSVFKRVSRDQGKR